MSIAPWCILPAIEAIGGRASGMARRRMAMLDLLEILVAWDAGEGISPIARRLGYMRTTVRKYVAAATALGIARGGGPRSETDWLTLATAVSTQVARQRAPGAVAAQVAQHHAYLE